MRLIFRALIVTTVFACTARAARADVCIAIDEARDTFSAQEREAAALLVGRQFEREGQRVSHENCTATYLLSHITLGNTIVVTLSGPAGEREGTALGMDDLPALYSQMVRSIVTGRPMSGFNVIDRTNVTAAQASTQRLPTDTFWYARLGYGGVFGDRAYGTPALGFGYRAELDTFGVDVSFFNYQAKPGDTYSYYGSNRAFAGSLLKLEGLYFINPTANRTSYVGAGLSWGSADFGSGWHGSGLQGELTAGYELPRASTLRIFFQTDAVLPFYNASAVRYPIDPRRSTQYTTDHRWAPSVVVSVGLGWQKDRHRRG